MPNSMKDTKLWITGLVPAVFTPMHPDGRLKLDIVDKIVDHLVSEGVSALYVCGGTGEGPSLTADERKAVVEAYLQATDERIPVIVQVGHNSLEQARELAQHAQDAGAAAISAVPPFFYNIDSQETLIDCLAIIISGAPELPFYYYHIPRLTHFDLDVVAFLQRASARLPSLHGVKYSNFTIFELQACVALDDGRFNILFGSDEMLLSGLVGGAQGAVGTTYNFAAPLYNRILAAFEGGDIQSAQDYQRYAVEMVRLISAYGTPSINLPAMKAVMKIIGLDCGPARLPIETPSSEEVQALKIDLTRNGFFEWERK